MGQLGNMGYKWIKTKTTGVRYREHPTRKHGAVKKDRYFTIRYTINNVLKEEGLGWASEGWTEEKAALKRSELREAYRTGIGSITLKEQREKSAKAKELSIQKEEENKKLSITLNDFYNTYFINMARNNTAERTFKSESGFYKNWLAPNLGDLAIKDISLVELEKLKTLMIKQEKSPRTINYVFGILSQIFSYAKKLGYIKGDVVTLQMKKIKFDNNRVRFLTKEEAITLLEALRKHSQQLYEISILSLYCGMRAGEIFNLHWSDVDLNNKCITLRDTKNTKTRIVYMPDNVFQMLSHKSMCAKKTSLLFLNKDGNKIKGVSHAFAHVVNIIKLNEGVVDTRQKVVFHTLRHTYASWLTQMGTDLYMVQKLMGHSSFAMTQRYAHLSPETLKKAVENFDERIKDE